MAQGNALLGQLNGRIGSVVFSRVRGKQQSRVHVESPANPETRAQRGQRVKFGTCAAFYRSAVRNLFKFAFEYKKPGESDYNAFLRYNLQNMVPQTRYAYEAGYPCVSDWAVSFGSLPSPVIGFPAEGSQNMQPYLDLSAVGFEGTDLTLGDISSALMMQYRLLPGDIVTVVSITSSFDVNGTLEFMKSDRNFCVADMQPSPSWIIRQFIIDPDSKVKRPSDIGLKLNSVVNGEVYFVHDADFSEPGANAVAVIFSRVTPKGVRVSTSRLVLPTPVQEAVKIGKSTEWWEFCADDWLNKTSLANVPVDILEGSIAYEK